MVLFRFKRSNINFSEAQASFAPLHEAEGMLSNVKASLYVPCSDSGSRGGCVGLMRCPDCTAFTDDLEVTAAVLVQQRTPRRKNLEWSSAPSDPVLMHGPCPYGVSRCCRSVCCDVASVFQGMEADVVAVVLLIRMHRLGSFQF